MKRTGNSLLLITVLLTTLLTAMVNAQDKASGDIKNILSDKEALTIFAANGDSMIIRPEHLGIVNGMATVGIHHDYVGVIDGLWGQPLVSSDFYLEPRLWGEKIKSDHYTWLPYQTEQTG